MRFLLAAGGTGGHLRPALATADALRLLDPDCDVRFLCSGRPVDRLFLGEDHYRSDALLPGLSRAPRRWEFHHWLMGYRRARRVLRDYQPDVVVGFGGYPTALAGLASRGVSSLIVRRRGNRSAVPLVLLEQNVIPGQAVRVFGPQAATVMLAFDAATENMPDTINRCVTGNPLSVDYDAGSELRPAGEFGLDHDRPILLCVGGSQGALGVNRMVLGARPQLAEEFPDLQILMLTGDPGYEEVKREVERIERPRTVVLPFHHDMRSLYEHADVVVARAGGTTLAEVAIVGRPLVLVPYPHHRDEHQLANARVFERGGAASIVEEGDGAVSQLVESVSTNLRDHIQKQEAARAARGLSFPDAASNCARKIVEIARMHREGR